MRLDLELLNWLLPAEINAPVQFSSAVRHCGHADLLKRRVQYVHAMRRRIHPPVHGGLRVRIVVGDILSHRRPAVTGLPYTGAGIGAVYGVGELGAGVNAGQRGRVVAPACSKFGFRLSGAKPALRRSTFMRSSVLSS